MLTRRLTLKRETLTELTADELRFFGAGEGDPEPTPPIFAPRTLPLRDCFATTQDSVVVCSQSCFSNCASCPC